MFGWQISRDTQQPQLLQGNPKIDGGENILLEKSEDRIIFMSMYNDIVLGEKQKTRNIVCRILQVFAAYARRFPKGHWSFFGPGTEETWHGAHIYKPNGSWNHVADLMMVNLRESGHPLFRGTTAFFRGSFNAKEVEDYRYTTTQIQRQQSCYFAQLFPSITSVSTEQLRIGVKNLLNRFQIILHQVQGTLRPR